MHDIFNETYLNILYESAGIMQFDLKKYIEFLKNGTFFDENGSIIKEDRTLTIDVPDSLIEYCYKNQDSYISVEKIKDMLKKSKHNRNLKKDQNIQLYFSVFNFSNKMEVRSFNYKFFNIDDEDNMQNALQYFNMYVKPYSGFFNIIDNVAVCIINCTSDIYQISNHELGHFLQTICGIRILKRDAYDRESEKESSLKKLNDIGLTLNDFQYYVNAKEFFPHIDELTVGLRKTYHKLK